LSLLNNIFIANQHSIYGTNNDGSAFQCFTPRDAGNNTVLQIGSGLWIYRSGESSELITLNNSDLTVYKATTLNNGLFVNINNNTSTIATFDNGNNINFYGDLYAKKKIYIGVNDPGGGAGDNAYLEYAAVTGEQTVLRIVTNNDTNDNINLKPSGNVGINTDTPAYKLDVNGTLRVFGETTLNNKLTITSGGLTVTGTCSATSFNATSDYRIKENVINLTNKSSFTVDHLRPVTYTNKLSGKQDIGLIAHELQEHYPFLVSGEKDGLENQSVNYIGLIGILIKEIQELKEKVKTLESTQLFITK
jgi:hypothetical protein